MIQSLQEADLNPDFSRISDPVRTELLNWISAFSSKESEMKKLDLLIRQNAALRSGKELLRSTSENGIDFDFPCLRNSPLNSIVAWSVIYDQKEILCAINTNLEEEAIAYVTVDDDLHPIDSKMFNLYASALCPKELNIEVRNGKALRLTVSAYGFVIYG